MKALFEELSRQFESIALGMLRALVHDQVIIPVSGQRAVVSRAAATPFCFHVCACNPVFLDCVPFVVDAGASGRHRLIVVAYSRFAG